MATGTVKFFKSEKGYGFIKEKETGKDIFVHVTGLTEEIRANDDVQFEIKEGNKGPNAILVKKISKN